MKIAPHGNPDNMGDLQEQLKQVFEGFDTSGDGTISKAELGKAISQSGKTPPDPKMIDALFKGIDKDGKGSLDFNEFVEFILSLPPPTDALRAAFLEMDTDGSGYLGKDELKVLLKKAGVEQISDAQLEQICNDVGGEDGRVSFEEFCSYFPQ
ncbi:CALM1 [Branchiostoma lanceolatum]|uniref:CALM1 protein n=1 Tax=Branchiostoma lanceolatum TaxID=7740 RepID=A0A8K0E8P2_BRALA|nr:CALM1 [Branchiostoma lanceolatum]